MSEPSSSKWSNVNFLSQDEEDFEITNKPPPVPRPVDHLSVPAPVIQNREMSSFMEITVSEPVKQGEGINAYISYKVNTMTNRSGFKSREFSVIRRYSDFVWLQGILSMSYAGVVIPPLPEKILVGRFSPEFIESRRRALEKFLNRTAIHPELMHSDQFKAFLEASDEGMNMFKNNDLKQPKRSKSNRGALLQWIDETVQQISTTLGSVSTVEKTPADIEFEEVQAYIEGLEPIMQDLHKHALGLTKRGREVADGMFEFGVAFTHLGQSEGEKLGEGLTHVGRCADALSTLAAEQVEREALHFEEPILDYIRIIGSVKAALQKRWDSKLTYETAIGDLDSKNVVNEKLLKQKMQGGSVKEEKLLQSSMDVARAQQRVDDAKLEYDIVTERVMREVERFKAEKLADFKKIILDYIQLQIEYNQKIEESWGAVIPHLEAIQGEEEENKVEEDSRENTSSKDVVL